MKYFLVGYESIRIAVCETRGAAEELILSYAQEFQYHDYLLRGLVHSLSVSAKGLWIDEMRGY